MRQAVILAGGKGTRLAERLGGRPKPLVDVDGIPLLQRQLDAVRRCGFTDVLLLVNHAADQIKAFCDDLAPNDLRITLIDDGLPRGTAGALVHAFPHLAERFLVIYGDTLFDVDLARFWEAHTASGANASLFLHPNDHPFDSDLVEIDEGNRVVAMRSAPHDPNAWLPNMVNAAMYVIERAAIAFWRRTPAPSDIARDLFPEMLALGKKLQGYVSWEYIKDIGTPKRLDKAVAHLRSGVIARARRDVPQKAVFLDRDGTINPLRGHLARAEDMDLIPGTAAAVKRLNNAEYRVVVVTNQPILARGETSVAELGRIHAKMEVLLGRGGGFIDRIYFCPHHPDAGFPGEITALKRVCSCRKPAPGMVDQATVDFNIDLRQSWLIGDSVRDIALAKARGIASVLVRTGAAGQDGRLAAAPDFVASDLADGVSIILDRWPVLSALAAPLAAKCLPGSVLLLGGLPQSGKTSLAGALALAIRAMGRDACVVPLDNWIRSASDRTSGMLGHYDMQAAEQAVASRAVGNDVIIAEGCPALLSPPLRALASLSVSVECAETARQSRLSHAVRALDVPPYAEDHAAIRAAGETADYRIEIPDVKSP